MKALKPNDDFDELPAGFTGIWIPSELYLHRNLNPADRELIGAIYSFQNSKKGFTSISHLARVINISRPHVSERVSRLIKAGFLTRDNQNKIRPTDKCFGLDDSPARGAKNAPLTFRNNADQG